MQTQTQSRNRKPIEILYPEVKIGGFSRVDGTIEFYNRINSLLSPEFTIMDFGAGRGWAFGDDPCPYRVNLMTFRGKVRFVVGVDIDEAVLTNQSVDSALVIKSDEPLPFEDSTFDLIIADWVLEHIANPEFASSELNRVLKPGGWICARTPNKYGYIGIGNQLVPKTLHTKLLSILQPSRLLIDKFPVQYKLNTLKAIRKYFLPSQYEVCLYQINSDPAYFGNSTIAWEIAKTLFHLTPDSLKAVLLIFMQKRDLSSNNK
jgi:SAM-dependent methyltransferase